MANKIIELISDFFNIDEKNEENNESKENITVEPEVQEQAEQQVELSSVIDFVRELEAYYTNDIFKKRSAYINNSLTEDEAIFLKKKIKEYEVSVKLITDIKEKLIEKERGCKELWGKTSYSFYSELENAKLKNTFEEAFEIVKQLTAVNVIPELDDIISKRLITYKKSWKLDENIPKNTSLRIIKREGNIETYQFGAFQKKVIDEDLGKELLPEQLSAINKINIQLSFKDPSVSNVWIRCAVIKRRQLEFLKKSTIFPNDWENDASEEIIYDIVDCCDIEYYIRAIMQLLISKKDYLVISIINPNSTFSRIVKDDVEVDLENRRVKIIDKMNFLLSERTGVYGDNLQVAYISRKQNLQKLMFFSFSDFVGNFLK